DDVLKGSLDQRRRANAEARLEPFPEVFAESLHILPRLVHPLSDHRADVRDDLGDLLRNLADPFYQRIDEALPELLCGLVCVRSCFRDSTRKLAQELPNSFRQLREELNRTI